MPSPELSEWTFENFLKLASNYFLHYLGRSFVKEGWLCRELSEPRRHCRADGGSERIIMLNKSERYQILKIWKLFCAFGQLPIEVDLANWRLRVPNIKKLWISVVSYYLYSFHSLFITVSLVYNCLFVPDSQLYQLVIHAILALSSVMCTFWYFVVYALDPGLFAKYVELTLVGNIGGTPDPEDGLKKHWAKRLREYSMQDLIAACSPYAVMATVAVISAVYVYDPSLTVLLYNALPTSLQNWATFGLLLVEEVRFIMTTSSITVPIWQLQVTSFDLVRTRLQALKQKIENGTVTRITTYRTLRSLQLYVSMFNKLNSYIIFTWKLMSMTGCIIVGFAAIAHFDERPLFGIMYYALMLDYVFLYGFIYEKAFKIPALFDETASRALLYLGGTRGDGFRKQIESIRPMAITVGRFHKMERTSTLIFMNFVVGNIVSMLVAFG